MRYLLLLSLLLSLTAFADPQTRPKIGLVLGGGGAKGAAHIGILNVLENNNVPIDFIAGTSIGAYIGGLYALGYNADQIEDIMFNVDWDKGFSDFIPREDLQYADKQLRDEYNITLRLGYSDATLKTASGLLLGQSAFQLLKLSTGVVSEFESFDDLPIPYRAVAADIVTAETVVLNHGSLVQAMRASSTVPGVVEPTVIDGRQLVDGAIVNNMPVDVVKLMGADIIIAVDIGSPLLTQEEINLPIDVLDQLSNILTINTTKRQIDLLGEKDLLIRPDIGALSTSDFSQMSVAMALGKKSALENKHKIQSLSLDDKQYSQYTRDKNLKKEQWIKAASRPVVGIQYENDSDVAVEIIERQLGISVGDLVSKEKLDDAISRIYALDIFDTVNAEFIDANAGRILVIKTRAKSWGPNYLHFGFSWQGDFSSDSQVSLDIAYILTDITDNGGQWKNEVSLGWESLLATEFYQPLDTDHDYFSRARVQYRQEKYAPGRFTQNNSRPALTYHYGQFSLGLGNSYTDNGISEMGVLAEIGQMNFEDSAYDVLDYYSMGTYLSFGFDNLNSINFPTQGNKLSLDFYLRKDQYAHPFLDNTENSSLEINFDWRGAVGVRQHTFVGVTSLATVLSDDDFTIRASELGGFLNLSGYHKDEFIGAHKVFAAAVYQYDLGRSIFGNAGLPLYLGGSLEMGNVWGINDSVKIDELITSGSLFLGTDTSFGPAVFGVGSGVALDRNKGNDIRAFFSLGKNW
ncbi:patatin [Psychromonas sp. MB-3u-54]|uniref:patatin-like phospholipase family protein n=1 Tax=Psychromonas sp. MB-3u-54 TaxID=2058319 RepID=UPI000C33C22F|nr:patatin-like phospholipase family protein [Psychromonas sp. MB-3u-54]PKH03179.1 patatin [Psychromonas sp. MB-3u-54]